MRTTLLILFLGIVFFGCNEPQVAEKEVDENEELELPAAQTQAIDSLNKWNYKGNGIR